MRNWEHHDRYINRLYGDIYNQPEDGGHTQLAKKVIDKWMALMTTCHSVLDVGCGTGFCQPIFESWKVSYEGICLGEDYIDAQAHGRNVKKMDFNFLEYPDDYVDMIFSRHSLEHSPMPLLTLMEWQRVARGWLGLVLPAPEWYTYSGRNHYHVMNREQVKNLLSVAGWRVLWEDVDVLMWDKYSEEMRPHEYWFMAEKKR